MVAEAFESSLTVVVPRRSNTRDHLYSTQSRRNNDRANCSQRPRCGVGCEYIRTCDELLYPPNPIRNLDNSRTAAQRAGHDFFFSRELSSPFKIAASDATSQRQDRAETTVAPLDSLGTPLRPVRRMEREGEPGSPEQTVG